MLSSPAIYRCQEVIFTSLANFISGVFDTPFWVSEKIVKETIADTWNWHKGLPTGMCRVYQLMKTGNRLLSLGREEWGRFMHKKGFEAFGEFLILSSDTNTEEPTQSILMFLSTILALQKHSSGMRLEFLKACLIFISKTTHPFAQILSQVLNIEQEHLGSELLINVLTAASNFTVGRFREELGDNNLAVDLCKLTLDISAGRPRTYSEPWVDPRTVLNPDQELSKCRDEIERIIVIATEFFNFEQLEQVQNALRNMLAASNDTASHQQMISRYLNDLEAPVNRMRMRDYFARGNKDQFKIYWRLLVNEKCAVKDFGDQCWIGDMVCGWQAFLAWGEHSEVEAISKRLDVAWMTG